MRLITAPMRSPFLITSGIFIVLLYYLLAYVSWKLALVSFGVFTFFAICYMGVAVLLKIIFRKLMNSVSLKLSAFFFTTAIIPTAMLILLAFLYAMFLVGISESYVFLRVIRYQYQQMSPDSEDVRFEADGTHLCFVAEDGRGQHLDDDFFKQIHELTGTDFTASMVKVSRVVNLDGEQVDTHTEPDKEEKMEELVIPLFSTLSEEEQDQLKGQGVIIGGRHMQYPIIFPIQIDGKKTRDIVLFMIRVDLKQFVVNLFKGESSFADVNRQVLLIIIPVSISFLIFQFYLLVKGMFFVGSITGSTRRLVHGVGEIRKGNFDYRIHNVEDQQLREVAESVNTMASEIQGLFLERMEREQMTRELEIARRIQSSVLLQGIFGEDLYRIAVHSRASRVVGGDYCNFYKKDSGIEILAGDVSGKGLGAAMYVSEVDGLFYGLAARREPAEVIVDALHRFFLDRGGGSTFFSATLLDIQPEAGVMTYFRLGDPPLLVHRKDGRWMIQRPKGMIAGMRGVENILPYLERVEIPLEEVDGAFIFSDGFLELFPEGLTEIMGLVEGLDLTNVETCHQALIQCVQERSEGVELMDDVTYALVSLVRS